MRRWCQSATLALLLAGAGPGYGAPLDVLDRELPALLQELDVPGAALVVVQGREVLALRGFGTVDPLAGTPVDPARHVFRIGSVSKPLTATTVLRVARAHELGLHDDLRDLLAPLPVRPALDTPLSLHHLLTHTAGFNERLFGQHVASPDGLLTLDGYLRRHLPPRFIEPGAVIAYNDHHTALAGWIAERLAGERFEQLARRELLGPLGMNATTFHQAGLPPSVADGVTRSWRRIGDAWQPYARDFVMTTPAAGAWSSAADMGKYLGALLDCRGPVLEAELCAVQLARQAGNHPRLPGRAYGFAESRHAGQRVLFKDGQASGFNARLLMVPDRGLGVFVVHNRNILGAFGAFEPAARFNRTVTGLVLEALLPDEGAAASPPPEPIAGTAERARRYAGDYRNVVAARHTWERIIGMFDDLRVRATPKGVDPGWGEYVEIEPGLLQWHEGDDGFLAFQARADGPDHLFIGGGAYERIPWYTASWFTPWYVLGTAVWFAGWLVLTTRRRPAGGRWLSALPAACLLGFLIGFGVLLARVDTQSLFHGAPASLLVLVDLPLVAAAAMVAQAVALVWRWSRLAGGGRLLELSNLALGVAFLAWLNYWQLLGYRLG